MDRLVGYQVSPLLWKTITRGLSAGRVQSVALRLICDREAEIEIFVKEEYWTVDGIFTDKTSAELKARLWKIDENKVEIGSEEESNKVVKRINQSTYRITNIEKKRRRRQPYAPYITSTLQQDAGRRLGYTVRKTMSIAQRLYEGIEVGDKGQIGLITYMRTDSTRVANEAVSGLRDWIVGKLGTEYVSDKPRIFKNKKSQVQDAHEAIRPTEIALSPDDIKSYLSADEFKLYDLIWRRFAASQMKPAEHDVTTVTIFNEKNDLEFRASGQILVFPGFLKIYSEFEGSKNEENGKTVIPKTLEAGGKLELMNVEPVQHFTQPPPRFNESSLVKTLDELGIGRPSTYASIISTLIDRKYVEREKRLFIPTDLGKTVKEILIKSFPDIFNVEFTARMEEELDRIETGMKWQQVVDDFYVPFQAALEEAESKKKELKKSTMEPVGRICPDCGSDLVYRWSKRGKFISCSGFPDCKHAESIEPVEIVEVDVDCPKCESKMLLRTGRYGKFYGCRTYPKCKGILPFTTGHVCPKKDCEGKIAEKQTKKGKIFFSCTNYPNCDFSSWDAPADGECPSCKAPTIFNKALKSKDPYNYCSQCKWKDSDQ